MALNFFRALQRRDRNFSMDLDGKPVPVQVVENDRARRLTLRILPGGNGLKVTTPSHIGDDEIASFLFRNRNWAAARIARMPETTKLQTGAVIPYRGVNRKIVWSGKLRGVVRAEDMDGEAVLLVPGNEENLGRKLLSWLKQQARKEIDEAVMRHAAKIDVRPKRIRITDTTSRWGSCSTTRTLSFSWRIIMAPPAVLDYLVAHEVAHLVEMNHSERFWNLTAKLCPDMETHKTWLKRNGNALHAIAV